MKRPVRLTLLFGAMMVMATEASLQPLAALAVSPTVGSGRPIASPAPAVRGSDTDVRTVRGANRAATLTPRRSGFINATQVYPFSDGVVYRVYAAPGNVTDILLQPGEALGAVASGDTVRWVIGDTTSGSGVSRRSHILVKPVSAGLSTNLVVTTDRRTYHLSLVSTRTTAMASLSWIYPQDQLLAIQRAAKAANEAAPIAAGVDLTQLHFNYVISGDKPAWRPIRAFDDGRQTFIEFPQALGVGEAPPLFLSGAKGEAELVNFRVRGHFYVVDRLFDTAELRLGLRHQDIVRITRTPPIVARRG